jgi:hypothetical protein
MHVHIVASVASTIKPSPLVAAPGHQFTRPPRHCAWNLKLARSAVVESVDMG